jgi:acyl-CoA reductase-like NAD-dependent aldehyde dehydrogenase
MTASKFLVGGEWRSTERVRSVVNPFDNRMAGEVCQAGASDIDEAISHAVEGFQHAKRLQAYERSDVLARVASGLESRKEEFSRLITSETGKPITFSRAEVDRSAFTFRYASEEAKRLDGSVLPLDLAPHSQDRIGILRRFPIGPVAAITPFNFPLNLVAHKLAPAIAVGNSFLLKPSSNAPMTSLLLGEILVASGYPKQAVNILPCGGSEAEQLIVDQRIKLVSFTGSPAVGWLLKSRAGKKRVTLELGGNAAVIVDAGVELPSVVKRIAAGAFGNAGQSCIAVQRVYVHRSLYDRFQELMVEAARATKFGDPFDDATVVGPMITESAAVQIEEWINEATGTGARIHCGGKRSGAVLEPTVLTGVKPDCRISCQEAFAPIVTVDPFENYEDAIASVNHSDFGLQAGVFTNDFCHVLMAYRELEVGGVVINDFPTYRIDNMPYGGVKDSGFGREGLKYAIEEMTEPKLLVINSQH